MSEPISNTVEIIESSVNKFDLDYKKLMVIKKCMVLVIGWNDTKTLAPRKGPLVRLPIESSAPFPLFTLISSSASRGFNCVDVFQATFSHIFNYKSLIPHSLKLQLEIF